MYRPLPALLAASLSTACAITEPIDATDSTAVFPTGRVVVELVRSAPPDEPGAPLGVTAIEVAGTGADGSTIDSGVSSRRIDYRVYEATVLGKFGVRSDTFEVFGLIGLGWDNVSLAVSHATGGSVDRTVDNFAGPVLGGDARWLLTDWLRPYARVQFHLMLPWAKIAQGELGLDLALSEAVHVVGGYRYWSFRTDDFDLLTGSGKVDLDLHGPFAGGELRF